MNVFKSVKRYSGVGNKWNNSFADIFKNKRSTKPPARLNSDIPPKELIDRAREIIELKLDGWTLEDIHLFLEDHFKLKKSVRISTIAAMNVEIKRLAAEHLEDILIDHYYKYEDLYKKATKIKNGRLQLKVLDAQERLLGIVNESDIKIQINNMFSLGEEDKTIIDHTILDQSQQNRLNRLLNKIDNIEVIDITDRQKP